VFCKKMITLVHGDLFTSSDSLAHCVSEDLVMGRGIAKTFRERFGRVHELKRQRRHVGEVAYILDEEQDRYLFYLVTKPKYWHKPTLETIRECLVTLKELCQRLHVTRLAMPQIACGLDRQEWTEVQPLIASVFEDTGIAITVYAYLATSLASSRPTASAASESCCAPATR